MGRENAIMGADSEAGFRDWLSVKRKRVSKSDRGKGTEHGVVESD